MAYDSFDAQTRNPQPYGTYRDTPDAKAKRQQAWGKVGASPLYGKKKREKAAARGRRAVVLAEG